MVNWQNFYRIILPVFISNVLPISANTCHVGWTYLPSTGFCYGKSAGLTVSITWRDAEKRCQAQGGHILTMNNAAEWRHVLSYFHVSWRNTWLGVWSYQLQTGKFHSIDGTAFQKFTRMCNGWNKAHGKRCMGLGYDGVSVCIFDQDCVHDNNMQVVCKAPPLNSPPATSKHYRCKVGWSYLPSTGYCYGKPAGDTSSITAANAEKSCYSQRGHLVTLGSLAEFRHVLSYFYVKWRNTWLGIWSDNLPTNIFYTVDNTPADFIKYDRWCNGWHKASGKRCIGLGYDGVSVCFFDQDCFKDNNMQVLCKAKPEIVYVKEDPKLPIPEMFEPESNQPLPTVPTIPAVETVAPTRKMSCYV